MESKIIFTLTFGNKSSKGIIKYKINVVTNLSELFSYYKEVTEMKVKPSVKTICEKCKIIKRKGRVMIICENPKHKQKQG